MTLPISPLHLPTRRAAAEVIANTVLMAFAGGLLSACAPEKPHFQSVDLTGADYASGFALTDHHGKTRTLKDFAGKAVVVFFGFTQCPDVCPTSMVELAQVQKLLDPDGDKLQVIFVSIDPDRDTQEVLKAYMANFDPRFIALRPTSTQLIAVARDFKIYYKKVDGATPSSYSMDHTAGSYVFDRKGHVRLFTRYGGGTDMLVSDLRQLIKSG